MTWKSRSNRFDVAILGSGFGGSILAWILAKKGRNVVLIDQAAHPRFAIGESSTPLADRMLERLGQEYGIVELERLACFGSWQEHYPEIACGKKRGFSYYRHTSQQGGIRESYPGENSLLVAASPSDARSDTHWYRADVDEFLFQRAVGAGCHHRVGHAVQSIAPGDRQTIELNNSTAVQADSVQADLIIDSTGGNAISAKLLGGRDLLASSDFNRDQESRTDVCFAHFRGVKSFSEYFSKHGRCTTASFSDPFNSDDAAQHHFLDIGWVWMLRMDNGVTSVGLVMDRPQPDAEELFQNRFARYPDLHAVLAEATLCPAAPGIVRRNQIERFWEPLVSQQCLLTPTTSLTISPLHSTGIAHALMGVDRLAKIALGYHDDRGTHQRRTMLYLGNHLMEAEQLNRLIRLTPANAASFDWFTVGSMAYFAAAIASEERLQAGDMPDSFWLAGDKAFRASVDQISQLRQRLGGRRSLGEVARLLKPWNTAGLLEPGNENRYAYTATK